MGPAALVGADVECAVGKGALEFGVARSADEVVGTVSVEVASNRRLAPGTRRMETRVGVR